jgi:hypothetical protein
MNPIDGPRLAKGRFWDRRERAEDRGFAVPNVCFKISDCPARSSLQWLGWSRRRKILQTLSSPIQFDG